MKNQTSPQTTAGTFTCARSPQETFACAPMKTAGARRLSKWLVTGILLAGLCATAATTTTATTTTTAADTKKRDMESIIDAGDGFYLTMRRSDPTKDYFGDVSTYPMDDSKAYTFLVKGNTVTVVSDCLIGGNAGPNEKTDWVAWGRPNCWCYPRQCRGDADGKKSGTKWVAISDLTILYAAYNKTDAQLALVPNGICADLDHKKTVAKRVTIPDLTIAYQYYNKVEGLVPICDQPPIITGPYNFWTAPNCKIWDVGTDISGSITVQDAKLCECKTHTSSISDTDYWEDLMGYVGFPSDTLKYSWSKQPGTNPESGEWTTGTTGSSVGWQAPPCTGTVIIALVADDLPAPMYDACPGAMTRDDYYILGITGTSTVSLPAGCSDAGGHDSSVHWNDTENLNVNPLGDWGIFTYWPVTGDVNFKYENCQWKCEISNVQVDTDVQVRAANYPGYVSITSASDVPCVDADLAKSDLNDSNLNDDSGAPLTKYWIHSAIVAHEQKHRTDWKNYYGAELNNAISFCEAMTVPIDCSDPSTTTCQAVYNLKIAEINKKFQDAWDIADNQYDDRSTPVDEAEVRAYEVENAIEQPVSDALPGGCKPP